MSVTIDLSDEVMAGLEAEAARREVTVAELIAEAAAKLAAVHAPPALARESASGLSISGVGASGGRHGWARDIDAALADGFGRD